MRAVSVTEIATSLGIHRDAAYSLVRFLSAAGLATLKGVRRPERGPGKGENVYALEDGAGERVYEMMKKLLSA